MKSQSLKFDGNWHYPTSIRAGIGRVNEIVTICAELGVKAPMLVTDPGLASLPMLQKLLTQCQVNGLNCHLFSAIKSNPTGTNVETGVQFAQNYECDGIIAFGGGSALDAGKAIALMIGQNRCLWDFEDVGNNWERVNVAGMLPTIAIPTTAGTGSEVGRASVITDEEAQIKRIIFHPNMLPSVVILDPALTTGLPANITAATGMDALSHALEAYCAPGFHPLADGIAVEAMRLVKNFLPKSVEDGDDLEARANMLTASMMGATAFQKGLGGMHALAHPLGAIYDCHHGLLNAVLMPYVLQANRLAITERITRLTQYLELEDQTFSGFLEWVLALRHDLKIPNTLAQIGVDLAKAEKVGKMAYHDPSAGGNPIKLDKRQYQQIFMAAVKGEAVLAMKEVPKKDLSTEGQVE